MSRLVSLLIVSVVTIASIGCATQLPSNSSITSVVPTSVLKPSPVSSLQITSSPAYKRVVGLIPIDTFSELMPIQIDGAIYANQPFTLTVVTYGSSSCTTPDGATVTITDTVVTITPYDLLPIEVACSADFAEHPRAVKVTFPFSGQSTIRIQGQNFEEQIITFEQTVNVLP